MFPDNFWVQLPGSTCFKKKSEDCITNYSFDKKIANISNIFKFNKKNENDVFFGRLQWAVKNETQI